MAISFVYLLIDNERSIGGIASHGSPTDTDPNEIDLEAGPADQIQCRICLEIDGRDFIAPCKCKGTSKYVHRECLDHWRAVKMLRMRLRSSHGLKKFIRRWLS
ncbi:uncharacterized protein LOC105782931 isoform X1 [Gossypium raimondii]|uniref:RING-CH-type domain-containing protein n=1 Tax=Gossypium raimondii TaxID=29730 RepID=A0A0D2Q407_GOSRA|nr:uncharacterized protein LOC105782931 isoform X1 [Gossypium raimondii]KJB14084.1 hypothetical protein B456_002G109900 [Gossypium raimondii]